MLCSKLSTPDLGYSPLSPTRHSTVHTMLLILLLVARAAAEWVEISQQHYRKPVRFSVLQDGPLLEDVQNPTRHTYDNQEVPPQNPTKNEFFDQDIKPVRPNPFLSENNPGTDPSRNTYIYQDSSQRPIENIYFKKDVLHKPTIDDLLKQSGAHLVQNPTRETYLNHSITEHNWNQNIHRYNNVRPNTNTRVTTNEPIFNDRDQNNQRPNSERNNKPDETRNHDGKNIVPDTTRLNDETVSGKIERVPNIGSVQRVQLANTPVKSPALKNNAPEKSSNQRNDIQATPKTDNFSDEMELVKDIFKDSHMEKVSMKPSNNFKHVFSSTEKVEQEETLISQENHGVTTKVPNEKTNSPTLNFHRHSFTPKPDFNTDVAHRQQSKDNYSRSKHNSVLEAAEAPVGNKTIATDNRPANPQEECNTKKDLPSFVTNEKCTETAKEEVRNNDESDKNQNKLSESLQFEQKHGEAENKSSSEKGKNSLSSSEVKVNTMENILKFMKVIADTISKNARRGANGKITYLNDLKQTLLANISESIENML